jgi:hypothetical protein
MAACLHRLFEAQTPIGRRRRSIKQAKQLCQQRPGRVHAQQQRQRQGRTRCSRSRRRRYRGVKWPSRQGRYIICVRPCWRRLARQALKQRRAVSLSSPRRRRALEAARRRPGGQTLHVRLQAWRTACPGGTHAARHVQSSPCQVPSCAEAGGVLCYRSSYLGLARWSLLRAPRQPPQTRLLCPFTTLTTLCPPACTRTLLIRTHHGTSPHRHDLPWHHWRPAQPPGTSPAAH